MKELEKLMGDAFIDDSHPRVEESAQEKAMKAKIAALKEKLKLEQEEAKAKQKAAEEKAIAEAEAKKKREEEEEK